MLVSRRLLLLLHVLRLVDYILLLMLLLLLMVIVVVRWLAVLIVMLRVDQTVPGCGGDGTLLMLLHLASVCGREAVLGLGAVLHLRRLLLQLSGSVVISRATVQDLAVLGKTLLNNLPYMEVYLYNSIPINFLSDGGSFYYKLLDLNWCAR